LIADVLSRFEYEKLAKITPQLKPPVDFVQLRASRTNFFLFLYNRLATKTRRAYSSDIHQYKCRLAGYVHSDTGSPFPAEPVWVMHFIVSLSGDENKEEIVLAPLFSY
jgi:hypothetical protein